MDSYGVVLGIYLRRRLSKCTCNCSSILDLKYVSRDLEIMRRFNCLFYIECDPSHLSRDPNTTSSDTVRNRIKTYI